MATLTPDLLHKLNAYWRAANYLSVGQIYLYDNPLLMRRLTLADVKQVMLGHWGTTPGQNFVYLHLNRVIKKYDIDMIFVSGPGHGGPATPSGPSARRLSAVRSAPPGGPTSPAATATARAVSVAPLRSPDRTNCSFALPPTRRCRTRPAALWRTTSKNACAVDTA